MARILIVEDEQRIASFVAKGLRPRATHHRRGRRRVTGLDHALSGEFDLVVLDIGLPGMDGFEVLDPAALARAASIPVIVLTARDSVTDTVSRARGRRRRLHAQAVPVRRAARPGPAAAPHRHRPAGHRRATTSSRSAAYASTCPHPPRHVGGSERRAVGPRVRRWPRPSCVNAGQVLSREQLLDHVWGYRLRPRVQRRRRLRRLPAQEVRCRPDHHRPRHGLSLPGLTDAS